MKYKLFSVIIRNFKYITYERPEIFNFDHNNLVILGGSNGYGKTTFFDAIELLITGRIKHFNPDILNNRKEKLDILANDKTKDIEIECSFVNMNESIDFKRIFKCDNDFESILLRNNVQCSVEDLYKCLNINENMFDIGVYISQLESLDFLQQKYKERKERLTNLLDNKSLKQNMDRVRNIQKCLKDKFEIYKNNECAKKDKLSNELTEVQTQITQLKLISADNNYFRLFKDKEIPFDNEKLDLSIKYSTMIHPVEELEKFLTDFNDYISLKRNKEIVAFLSKDKSVFMALYYKDEIRTIIDQKEYIVNLLDIQKWLVDYQNNNVYLNKAIIDFLEINNDIKDHVNKLLDDKKQLISQLSDTNKIIKKLIDNRENLIKSYKECSDNDVIEANRCPLCGKMDRDLLVLFDKTKKLLEAGIGTKVDDIKKVDENILEVFEKNITYKAVNVLKENFNLLNKYQQVYNYKDVATDDLNAFLIKENYMNFKNSSDNIDFELFEKDLKELYDFLNGKKIKVEKVIGEDTFENYKNLHIKYYNNSNVHNVEDIKKKKLYICSQYSNSLRKNETELTEKFKIISEKLENEIKKIEGLDKNFDTLVIKYNAAYKQYQSDIVKSICIPLYIYSGKIIQNYPLGLGIIAQVNENQVVFQSNILEKDIFNILSTGQLNGVVISILLAVKSVFNNSEGLDILLIDDPLQSIDDISSLSFADLLTTQFENSQIILSTHEDEKVEILKFKFNQHGRKYLDIDMQDRYLNN